MRCPAAQVHHDAPGDHGRRGEHLCGAAQPAQARRERGDPEDPEPHDRRPEFLEQRSLGGGRLAAEHDGHRAAGGGLAAEDSAGVVDVDRIAGRQHRRPGQRQQQRPGLAVVPPAQQVRQADQRHQDDKHRRVQGGDGARRRGLVDRDQRRDRHHQQEEGGDEVGVTAPGEAVERAGQHQAGQCRRAEPVLPAPQPGGQRIGAERGDHEQHRCQYREQRQRGEAREPADDRGERGEPGRVDQVAGVLAVRQHLLGHDRVRVLVPAADVGPLETHHAGVDTARGQHQDHGQATVAHHRQRQAERPRGRLGRARGLRRCGGWRCLRRGRGGRLAVPGCGGPRSR